MERNQFTLPHPNVYSLYYDEADNVNFPHVGDFLETEKFLKNKKGFFYKEGFTSFYALYTDEGPKIYKNEKELSEREKEYGSSVPRVSREQIEEMKLLAEKFEFPENTRVYFLVINDESQIIHNDESQIRIIGARFGDCEDFVFAEEDENLKQYPHSSSSDAFEIFIKEGMVVMAGENKSDNPVTIIAKNSPYDIITRKFNDLSEGNKISFTQFIVYLFATNQELWFGFMTKKQIKITKAIKILHHLYNILTPEFMLGDGRLVLKYKEGEEENKMLQNAKIKNIEASWKKIVGECRKRVNQGAIPEFLFREICTEKKFMIEVARIVDFWDVIEIVS
jgi:hypothetical protein